MIKGVIEFDDINEKIEIFPKMIKGENNSALENFLKAENIKFENKTELDFITLKLYAFGILFVIILILMTLESLFY